MVSLLALPVQTKIDDIMKEVPRPASGLPINALPGWERVPLCNKLPMLDTPTNEIIFSRGKMGVKLWKPAEFVLYDPNCYFVKLTYDSLHDPHLKDFYSRSANFERIKEIGRVTDEKDVICTLREFNDYRRYLRRLQLDAINEKVQQIEAEKRDRYLIKMAEDVAQKQREQLRNIAGRTKSDILKAKEERERERREKALQMTNNLTRNIARIEALKQWKKQVLKEKSKMHNLEIRDRLNRAREAEKLRIIALKKKMNMREMQLKKFLKNHFDEIKDMKLVKVLAYWQKRLEFRAWKSEQNAQIRRKARLLREECVEKHKQLMQAKWDRIQMQIAQKSIEHQQKDLMDKLTHELQMKLLKRRRRRSRKLRKPRKIQRDQPQPSSDASQIPENISKDISSVQRRSSLRQNGQRKLKKYSVAMAKHSQQELRDALSTAISMQEMPPSNRESAEKILSSAKYILEKVFKSVRRNLGEDLQAREYMYHRIEDLFYRTKKHVLLKVERVLQVADGIPSRKSSEFGPTKSCPISKSFILPLWSKSLVNTMSKTVSFGDIEPIGKTAQLIDPSIELKSVKSRTPTPASSFISLNAVVRETCTDRDVQIPVKTRENRYDLPHWSPNERIFVEHFYIKFKKALLVGVERAVFDAIDLKKNEVQLSSRREILELDREYLINIMAESILTYNLNSYNYFGNTRLCISVLAAECLFDLQSTPLRAKYDSSYRVEPRCRCNIGSFGKTFPLKNSCSFK